jgi:hypothetical protein
MLPPLIRGERSAAVGFIWLDDRHRQAERQMEALTSRPPPARTGPNAAEPKPVLDQSVGSGGVGHP